MNTLLQIIDEILAEHPEYQPACELLMAKLDERITGEVMFLRQMVLRGVRPGSTKTQ